MTRRKIRVGARPTRRDRDRKDRDALRKAHQRAAKAATLREEVGDIEEAVVPYEHKGGQVGDSIRLRRMNPSSVSGDAAQPAPQLPLPVASPPPQPPAPPPEPLSDIAAAEAAVARLPPFERNKFDHPCALCNATDSYLDEVVTDDKGGRMYVCSDTDYCEDRRAHGHRGSQLADQMPGASLIQKPNAEAAE
jgi:hypothetical protein